MRSERKSVYCAGLCRPMEEPGPLLQVVGSHLEDSEYRLIQCVNLFLTFSSQPYKVGTITNSQPAEGKLRSREVKQCVHSHRLGAWGAGIQREVVELPRSLTTAGRGQILTQVGKPLVSQAFHHQMADSTSAKIRAPLPRWGTSQGWEASTAWLRQESLLVSDCNPSSQNANLFPPVPTPDPSSPKQSSQDSRGQASGLCLESPKPQRPPDILDQPRTFCSQQ